MLAILVGEEDAAVPVEEGEGDVGLLTDGFFFSSFVSANDVDLIILLKKEKEKVIVSILKKIKVNHSSFTIQP